jgi:hypothetical protein
LAEILIFVFLFHHAFQVYIQETYGKLHYLLVEGIFLTLAITIPLVLSSTFLIIRSKNFLKTLKINKRLVLFAIIFLFAFSTINLPFKMMQKNKFEDTHFLAKLYAHWDMTSPGKLTSEGKSTWAQDVWSIEQPNVHSEVFQYPKRYDTNLLLDMLWTNAKKRTSIISNRYIYRYFSWPEKLLVILGALYLFLNKKTRHFFFFLLIVFGSTFCGIMFLNPSANERYIFNIIPAIIIFLTSGANLLLNVTKNKAYKIAIFTLLGYIFLYHGAYKFPAKDLLSEESLKVQDIQLTSVDRWLEENDPGKKIISTHEGAGFYSRSEIIFTPNVKNLQELNAYAQYWGASYIIALPEELPGYLQFLYKEPKNYDGLELILNKEGIRAKIYKFTYKKHT